MNQPQYKQWNKLKRACKQNQRISRKTLRFKLVLLNILQSAHYAWLLRNLLPINFSNQNILQKIKALLYNSGDQSFKTNTIYCQAKTNAKPNVKSIRHLSWTILYSSFLQILLLEELRKGRNLRNMISHLFLTRNIK